MAIYRGPGGSGDATQDAASEVLLAVQAKEAALAAQAAAEAAQTAAELAETNAETAETNAETAETNAETAATNAANSASAASTSATNAASSASAASTSASNASTSATNASNSASAASTSASNAASSASSASTSASTATTQATNAATSASAAATSATNAAGSATAAATSASNAASSATSASGSASTATTQATNASNSASAASTSASNAASSASAAATSATNAASSATSAAGSATTATAQATNASNSATAAATSATNAANSATAVATSATNAANSATSAATSATNAANSATAAAASAASINPASIVITGGSINGTTIGATTPSTGKFTTLEATGVTTVQAGTVSAPAITTSGDTNTGIFFPAADTIAFTEGGVESMRIDSSGNVGIGVTPSAWGSGYKALQVGQNTSLAGNTGASVGLLNTNAYFDGSSYKYITTDAATQYQQNTGEHIWRTAASGTAGNTLTFTERMRIDSSGNVGIGTSTPDIYSTGLARQFTVSTTTTNGYAVGTFAGGANVSGGVEFGNQTIRHSGIYGLDGSGVSLWTNATNSGSGLTERMRITAAGEVCVNATSAYGSARFYVNAPQPTSANWWVSTLRTASTSIATTMIAFIDGSNDFCGQVYIDPPSNSTVFSTSSDYRLKDNVAPMTGALAKVQALNPVTYTWKKSGKTGQGFIAHELQEIVPECVVGEKDAMRTYIDEEGNEQTAILPQMVDTSFLVATLTKAIQEQQAMIEELKAKVTALENK